MDNGPDNTNPIDTVFFGEHADDEETDEILRKVRYAQMFNDPGRSRTVPEITERPATYDGVVQVPEPEITEDMDVNGDYL